MGKKSKYLRYTILPDFGNAPWAWVKDASDEATCVGALCAQGLYWSGEHSISKELVSDFGTWAIYYDNQEFYQLEERLNFDWEGFHAKGWALCARLKEEISDAAMVCYVKPSEDPFCDHAIGVEFLIGDGTRNYVCKKYIQNNAYQFESYFFAIDDCKRTRQRQ